MKKVHINLLKPVRDLEGQNVIENDIGIFYCKIIANVLINSVANPHNPVKLYDLAVKFYNTGAVEVDQADAQMIRDLVAANQNITNLVKGPVLRDIDAAIVESNKEAA